MSNDFEMVREKLGTSKWNVFGGSWGSTLGLDYAERYADRCPGLIIRGIFQNTEEEFDAVYARKSFSADERRAGEFDTFFALAAEEAARRGKAGRARPGRQSAVPPLYEDMILQPEGRADAIWRFYAFEANLMEEDPTRLLDPLACPGAGTPALREAASVAFFEARLFLRGTFEEPVDPSAASQPCTACLPGCARASRMRCALRRTRAASSTASRGRGSATSHASWRPTTRRAPAECPTR